MNRTRWFDIGAIALAVAISVGVAGVSCSSGVAAPAPTASTVRDQRQGAADAPLALFIGDSYTAGGSTTEMSYGCRAAVQMGWLCALSAMGGTGYISGGVANRWVDPHFGKSLSFSERVPHLAAQYDPALVILDGGRNDVFAATRRGVHRHAEDDYGGPPHVAEGANHFYTAEVSRQPPRRFGL